jgi:hypothetical protein
MKTKLLTPWFICFAIVSSILISCQKEDTHPSPKPEPVEHELNFKYVDNFQSTEFELIITDSSGAYLLDTILPVQQMVSAKFRSDETRFNVTTIENRSGSNSNPSYSVKTYYQVALKPWNINHDFVLVPKSTAPDLPQGSFINYINTPPINFTDPSPVFFSGFGGGAGQGTAYMNYRQPDPYYAYILFTSSRLYNFHQTAGNNDTVNCAKMDTALSITYRKNFELSNSFRELAGYKKKDDYSTYTRLWDGAFDPVGTTYGDFIYPPKGVEQYMAKLIAFDKQGGVHLTRTLADKMPDSLELLDDSYVNITKKDTDRYEFTFPRGPLTTYSCYLQNARFGWEIFFPSNKTSYKSTDKLIDLKKSKFLNSFNISSTKLSYITLLKADNYNLK